MVEERGSGLDVVRAALAVEGKMEGVAQLVLVAFAQQVAQDVAAGLQGIAAGEPFADRARVRRLVELAVAALAA